MILKKKMNRKVRMVSLAMCLFSYLYSVQGTPIEIKDTVEKDRAAILAMAGEYEISFKFMETFAISKGYELKKPYLAEATEMVFVVKDSPTNIILQHVLWLEDLERVVKHWKQEWKFEDKILHEFTGNNTWSRRALSDAEVRGTWTQKVYQVDDSPRYESYGSWSHEGGMSSWQGSKTRRPLPRREYTKRADYEIMMAVNRHTITPTGWVHEQDNFKQVSATGEILCREVGLNDYERTDLVDFTKVKDYWTQNSSYWIFVSSIFDTNMESSGPIFALHKEVDGSPLYRALFGVIKDTSDEALRKEKAKSIIRSFLK